MKHLILGGKGFLGSHLFTFLKSKKYKVSRCSGVDLRNYDIVRAAIRGFDFVYLMAANMGGIGYFSQEQYYPTLDNFQIDINVLRACEENKVKRLFYPSSACAYSTDLMKRGVDLEELMLDWKAQPDQMYGWEKLTMIKLMRHAPFDIRVGVLHTIYGEGQAYAGKKAKFPPQIAYKMILAEKTGQVEVWGDGKQTRTFLHIDDAVEKIWAVMMNDDYWGEVNIGSDKEVSVHEVVTLCSDLLQINPEIIYNKSKPVGPARRLCNNEKFNKYYNVKEKISLAEGFIRLITYIKQHEKGMVLG